jgi:glycosyl transferase family 25
MGLKLKTIHWNIIVIIVILIIIALFNYGMNTESTVMSFPPTLVINMNKDTERLKTLREDFKFAGWPVPLERVEAVERKPGYIGCALSHMKCMELALERNYDWVLILEDDCLLKPRARDRFMALLPELWKRRSEWDNYYAGPVGIYPENGYKVINKDLGLIQIGGDCLHFVLIHKEACKKILKKLNGLEKIPVIDIYYRTHFRTFTSVPYIAIQKPGESNIQTREGKTYMDFTEEYNQSEQKLIALL